MISKRLSSELNCFRWIAAFMVVVSHLRNILFVEYVALENKTIPVKLLYFFTGFGHEAVVVFFVISGLLVGGTAIDKYAKGRFDPADFVIHRFSRIYIVLIPALAACSLLDHAGLAYFNGSLLYTQGSQPNYHTVFAENMDWGTALANLFMMQHISSNMFGSDGPLWSLSYEWWYYSLFFLATAGIAWARSLWVRGLSGALILLLLYWLPVEPIVWFSIWLLGAAIGFSPLRRLRIPPLLAYAIFFSILIWSRFDHTYAHSHTLLTNFRRDFAVAIGCFLLFTALRRSESLKAKGEKFHRFFAEFSYTIYLVHLPFIAFMAAAMQQVFEIRFYQQPTLFGCLYFVSLLTATYLYSYGFSLLTERYTPRLRAALNSVYHSWRGYAADDGSVFAQEPAATKNAAVPGDY